MARERGPGSRPRYPTPSLSVDPRKGKRAEAADRLASSGLLTGRSEEFRRFTREMRDGFELREPPASWPRPRDD